MLYQLQMSGWSPNVAEKAIEDFTIEIAENNLSRYRRYVDLKTSGSDPEVRFISYWLRSNFRKIDRHSYAVTYRELEKILNRYNFTLENPQGNYIDLIRIEERAKSFLGLFKRTNTQRTKIGQIGFPRWTAQVRAAAVKSVREMTGLTSGDGVDSGAFFHGLDPLQSLIASYHEPLRRLSSR